jgi:hypothetical protein
MYVVVALAGLLIDLAIEQTLVFRSGMKHTGYLALGMTLPPSVAIYKLWPNTSIPFWLSIVVAIVALGFIGRSMGEPSQAENARPSAGSVLGTSQLGMAASAGTIDLRRQSFRKIQEQARFALPAEYESAARKAVQVFTEGYEWEQRGTDHLHPHHFNSQKHEECKRMYQAKYSELAPIGQNIYERGGHDAMLLVAERVRLLAGDLCARYIESYWAGIGQWQG